MAFEIKRPTRAARKEGYRHRKFLFFGQASRSKGTRRPRFVKQIFCSKADFQLCHMETEPSNLTNVVNWENVRSISEVDAMLSGPSVEEFRTDKTEELGNLEDSVKLNGRLVLDYSGLVREKEDGVLPLYVPNSRRQ